ncbi:YopT-type cysteine protease domain-containing protein [Kistimonas asteriae]|uniref:YopT-type cysteine protease domain-containing protein n=1 Tax=Kistimonas asteriae TaxID=517724 RepID=UPI001BA8CFED|nr:YopT-type cysteine protease domain-containing protein [Kistimonas asteriae]
MRESVAPDKSFARSLSFDPSKYEKKRGFLSKFTLFKTDPIYLLGACVATGCFCRALGIESWVKRTLVFMPIGFVTFVIREARSGLYNEHFEELGAACGTTKLSDECKKLGGNTGPSYSQVSLNYLYRKDAALEQGIKPSVCRGLVAAWLDGKGNDFNTEFFDRGIQYQQQHAGKAFIFTILDTFEDLGLKNTVEGELKIEGVKIAVIKEDEVKLKDKDNTLNRGSSHYIIQLLKDSKGEFQISQTIDTLVKNMRTTDRAFVHIIGADDKGHVLGIKVESEMLTFFDPNLGVFFVPLDKSGYLFDVVLNELSYEIEKVFITPLSPSMSS